MNDKPPDLHRRDRPILCLDFDGVIHSFTSGWKGADVIPDPPVPGALSFIMEALDTFDVQIFSSRSHQENGIRAMQMWLCSWLGRDILYSPDKWLDLINTIGWPTEKPPAFLTIDDRAMTFTGVWPRPEDLLRFRPWNKQETAEQPLGSGMPKPAKPVTGTWEGVRFTETAKLPLGADKPVVVDESPTPDPVAAPAPSEAPDAGKADPADSRWEKARAGLFASRKASPDEPDTGHDAGGVGLPPPSNPDAPKTDDGYRPVPGSLGATEPPARTVPRQMPDGEKLLGRLTEIFDRYKIKPIDYRRIWRLTTDSPTLKIAPKDFYFKSKAQHEMRRRILRDILMEIATPTREQIEYATGKSDSVATIWTAMVRRLHDQLGF